MWPTTSSPSRCVTLITRRSRPHTDISMTFGAFKSLTLSEAAYQMDITETVWWCIRSIWELIMPLLLPFFYVRHILTIVQYYINTQYIINVLLCFRAQVSSASWPKSSSQKISFKENVQRWGHILIIGYRSLSVHCITFFIPVNDLACSQNPAWGLQTQEHLLN